VDLSAERAPGGALTPFQEGLRRTARGVIEAHRNCITSRTCDLYHNLIEILNDLASEVRAEERALLICGHPAACAPDGAPCMACQRETRLAGQVGNLS
jgi:hypothetical protein